jgi:Phosphoinositide phospholipase C, Ca2+-dependent
MSKRVSLVALAALTLVVLVVASAAAEAGRSGTGGHASRGPVRMNQVQVIGTHNSYHRELSKQVEATYEELIGQPDDYDRFLAYSHASIPNQLARQDVRGLELDLFPDPRGGLYSEPLVRQRLGLGPLPDPAWRQPGVKVFHIADLDYETTCVHLVTCLEQVREWSDANPGHVPILIMLELKQSDERAVRQGGVVAPPWDAGALDSLDAEIRSVFDEWDMITPDDVRRRGLTLEQSVLRHGWPTLRKSRGQVAFLLDNEPGKIRDAYTAGRPSLEGRVIFTNTNPGSPDSAFAKRNDPLGANASRIQGLVRDGYLVRTRSDLPLETVTSGDTTMLEAALASGAHLISTDFPEVGMSARYGSDYVARLPEGGPARCNPVNSSRRCHGDGLER